MKKKTCYFLILLVASAQLTLSIDKLTQYKLALLKKYKPEMSWTYLEWDQSFGLKYITPESFLKYPT